MLCPAFWLRTCYCFVILFLGLVAGSAQVFLASANEITDQLTLEMRIPKSLSRAEEQALKPKDLFKECDNCPEMIVVPAGEFMMGSPEDEEGHTEDESPQHKVQLLTPFAVGRFAVTFEEWDACVADHGCRKYMPPDRGWGRGRQPVIAIWWDDAIAYVRWVSQKTGRNYRLLSEAEREYVARAGTTTPFWWGNSIFSNRANYASSRGERFNGKLCPLILLNQIHGACTRCMAMSRSGLVTAGITIMKVRRWMVRRGPVLNANGQCCAAVTGIPHHGSCAPRRVGGGPPLHFFYPLSECGSHGRFDERAAMRLQREIMRRANPSTVLS